MYSLTFHGIECLDLYFDFSRSINNTISFFIKAANDFGYKMIDHSGL